MLVTNDLKQKVLKALQQKRENFEGSDFKFSNSIGINNAQYSRIKNGETERVISDQNWISLARLLQVGVKNENEWKIAETPVFTYIINQLSKCQNDSISSLICDLADIGKTVAARHYTKTNKNVVYIDCSQVKTKQKLVRGIAKEFGVNSTGKYQDVYEDLVYYLRSIPNPMVILDEAGDLNYDAFLELKGLWNATERACGWMMIGADGLKEKMRRAIACKKVGFTEIFSRYGQRYQRITPEGKEEADQFTKLQAALIIKANAPAGTDIPQMLRNSEGSLRRVYNEISKL